MTLAEPVGQTNGLKVAGAGPSKGGSFVNGTGVSDAAAATPVEKHERRTSFLTKWQLLAVIVAVLIVIPTFIFLSHSNESGKYAIDGDFGEWNDATMYGVIAESTSSSSNIVDWAVATQSADLFLYIKTQTDMMSSTTAETYYLFVDSDGSNATGYFIESIGADFLLQLTGWDYSVESTSLSTYSSSSDQHNWSAWTSVGGLAVSLESSRAEARAALPNEPAQSSKFLLVSKDSKERGSVSITAPLSGGTLIVRQSPPAEIATTGIVPKSGSVDLLSLVFSCDGDDGLVNQISPILAGSTLANQIPSFSLTDGEEKTVTVSVDTSTATDGELISARVLSSSISSTFACIEVIGVGSSAYASAAPTTVEIDGAFADWTGHTSADHDLVAVDNPNLDIDRVGNVSTSNASYFYVSVAGEICSGSFVPASVGKPSGTGGGVVAVLPRRTAEDVMDIYVDSDRSVSTGRLVSYESKQIGADYLIELKGFFGSITSKAEFTYSASNGKWLLSEAIVDAAKDHSRIEIAVTSASLGGSSDIDFIVETTSWKGVGDIATYEASTAGALTRTWILEPATGSPYSTAMSYQRKMFYDGINYWSFFFDGADTTFKYSIDGSTWVPSGTVFSTPRVNETSIWWDPASSTVYAVGDVSIASNAIVVQTGVVDPQSHAISWATTDSVVRTSTFPIAGKNTYLSKDANGYLWILSTNCTQLAPDAYQLSAFRSAEVNRTDAWILTGQMLAANSPIDNIKGSIVPAGSGSDMWGVYAYAGNVASRKFTSSWQAPQIIYTQAGSKASTDNSPPSVVVDGKGVVHVVYGTGRRTGQVSTPTIEYSHNNTDLTTFTVGLNLDPLIQPGIGDYYPTITCDQSTNDLYVLWLQSDSTFVPQTVIGKRLTSGTWTDMVIEGQTTYPKAFLTSPYSAPDPLTICWQWSQNYTAPFEVWFDGTLIPEFGSVVLPAGLLLTMLVVCGSRLRRRQTRY